MIEVRLLSILATIPIKHLKVPVEYGFSYAPVGTVTDWVECDGPSATRKKSRVNEDGGDKPRERWRSLMFLGHDHSEKKSCTNQTE